jgi:hypothetical protein
MCVLRLSEDENIRLKLDTKERQINCDLYCKNYEYLVIGIAFRQIQVHTPLMQFLVSQEAFHVVWSAKTYLLENVTDSLSKP